jgi:transaldolase
MTQIFLDTADLDEVRRWMARGVIDGVTTNATLLRRQAVRDLRAAVLAVAELVEGRPVSVPVIADDEAEAERQGTVLAGWAANVVVKVPVVNSAGEPMLCAIHALSRSGVRVNATACLAFGQAVLAAKAGATYVSLLAGRIGDAGGDGIGDVGRLAQWLDRARCGTRLIVGSVRQPGDVQAAVLAGAHVVTVPPPVLGKLARNEGARVTAAQFLEDGLALGWAGPRLVEGGAGVAAADPARTS